MARALTLAVLLLVGCTGNRLGQMVTVTTLEHAVSAQPEGLAECAPFVVFIEGDGSQCQAFAEGFWRRWVERRVGAHVLVRPIEPRNELCDGPAFAGLDFLGRLPPLHGVLVQLRHREPRRPVVLLGHSAGAHLAVMLATEHPELVDGVVNLGGGVDQLSVVMATLASQWTDHQVAQLEQVLERLASDEPGSAPLWQRTLAFWRQMFFSGVRERWAALEQPLYLAHGELDLSSVPFPLVERSVAELDLARRPGTTVRFFANEGHDLLVDPVLVEIDGWLKRSKLDGCRARP